MACKRECSSFATKLSRLDACEDRKVVRWCRTQASIHNSQGVVDGKVIEAGVSICGTRQEHANFSFQKRTTLKVDMKEVPVLQSYNSLQNVYVQMC